MNSYIKTFFVFLLALVLGFAWTQVQAGKPVKVTVTAAVPDSAIQGDTEEVLIDGTGFDAGSTARFLVTGTQDDSQIDVNGVTFDSATGKLKANIKVKDAALPVEYDIEVRTSSGRRGKGTTLFRVRQKAGEEDPCLTTTSYFPAFAYVDYYEGKKQDGAFDIHVASADAVCDIIIYTGAVVPNGEVISFRYYDNGDGTGTGKITWAKNWDTYEEGSLPVVRMLEFHVANRKVTDALPVLSELLLQHHQSVSSGSSSWQGNVGSPDLAPNSDRIVYYAYEDYVNFYLAELELDACATPPCIQQFFEVSDGSKSPPFASNPKYSLNWPRVYFKRYRDANGMYAFGYVDKEGDSWSEPLLVSVPDFIWSINVGLWDWNDDGSAEEVLVVSTGSGSDYFNEVWGCLEPGETPCLVLTGVPGRDAAIKSVDGNPSLIYRYTYTNNTRSGPAIFEYDLATGETRMLVDQPPGRNHKIVLVDAAD